MSDEKAVDLVLRARNEVSQGADAASDSLGQLAQEAQQLDNEFKQLEAAGAIGQEFEQLRDAVSNLNAELSSAKGVQQNINNFKQLKTATAEAEKEWQSATDRVKELAKEMAASENPSKAMERDFARAKKAAASSKDAFEKKRQSLQQLRTELGKSGVNTKDLGTAQQQLTTRTKELKTELDQAKQRTKEMGTAASKAAAGFSTMQRAIGAASAALVAMGAKRQFDAVVNEQEQLQRNLLRTEQLIRQTGRAGDASAAQLHEQARALALATLGSTEGIMQSQQQLLAFRNISTETFDEIIERALDITTVLGNGMPEAIKQLGRALSDPVKNLGALSEAGIQFSAEQETVIKSLAETGQMAEAQAMILEQLKAQYGGVAREEARAFAGAQDTLGQAIQEARIAVSDYLSVGENLSDLYNRISEELFIFNEALRAGDYQQTIAGAKGIATALGALTLAYLAATKGATAYSAAMWGTVSASKAAISVMVALGKVVSRHPLGALAAVLGSAAAGFAVFNSSASDLGESLDELALASELAEKNIALLKDSELDAALLNSRNAAVQTGMAINEITATINALEAKQIQLDATGESLSVREKRRLVNGRLELDRLNAVYDQQRQRLSAIQREQLLVEQGLRKQAEATDELEKSSDKLAATQTRGATAAKELMESLGVSMDELETGITDAERQMINQFLRVQYEGEMTGDVLARLADKLVASLKSDEARSMVSALGGAAAEAVERAGRAGEGAAARATGRINQLSQAVSNLLNEGQRTEFELISAAESAQTQRELDAIRQSLANVSSTQTEQYVAGQRGADNMVNTYRVMQQITQRQKELQGQTKAGTDQATQSIQRQTQQVTGLQQAINAIPDISTKNIDLIISTTPQQLTQDINRLINQLNIEVPVKLVANQQELAELTQAISRAAKSTASSVAKELINEIRKRG